MGERLTDEQLTSWFLISLDDDRLEQPTAIRPVMLRRMITELRERRAADMTDADRVVLDQLRSRITLEWPNGNALARVLSVLDRLLNGGK